MNIPYPHLVKEGFSEKYTPFFTRFLGEEGLPFQHLDVAAMTKDSRKSKKVRILKERVDINGLYGFIKWHYHWHQKDLRKWCLKNWKSYLNTDMKKVYKALNNDFYLKAKDVI